jgi:hypothetical protein
MKSVYLAARYSRRDELRKYASRLREAGIIVTSRWLRESGPLNTKLGDDTPAFYRRTAIIDLEDIDKADTIVFFSEDPLVGTPRGGRHVEYGYALGTGKRLVVLGGEENIFHYLDGTAGRPNVIHYPDFQAFVGGEL